MVLALHDCAVIINATADQHRDIITDLLAAHELTGCYTVETYFGIGKAVAFIRVLTYAAHDLRHTLRRRHKSRSVRGQCLGDTCHSGMLWSD